MNTIYQSERRARGEAIRHTDKIYQTLAALAPLALQFDVLGLPVTAGLILLAAAALLLKSKAMRINHFRKSLTQLRDSTAELSLRLEKGDRRPALFERGHREKLHSLLLEKLDLRNRIELAIYQYRNR